MAESILLAIDFQYQDYIKTATNSALAHMAGRRTNNQQQIANLLLFQGDRTLLSCKTINEHLYIYQHRLWADEYKAATSPML